MTPETQSPVANRKSAIPSMFLLAIAFSLPLFGAPMEIPLTSENTSFTVVQGYPDTEAGKSKPAAPLGEIYRRHWDGRGVASLLLIEDLPKIAADRVEKAELKIYVTDTKQWGAATEAVWMVKAIPPASTDAGYAWEASTLTYDTAGDSLKALMSANNHEGQAGDKAVGPLNTGSPEDTSALGWYSVDITPILKDWIATPASNNGLVITAADTHANGNGYIQFASPFHDFEDPATTPRLVITLKP